MDKAVFKPGDRVRTVSKPGYTPLKGAGLEYVIKGASDYVSVDWGVLYELEGVTYGAYAIGLELVEPSLEEQQAAAKAELNRINALIAERDAPKVGREFLKVDGKYLAVVQEVFEGVVFYRSCSTAPYLRGWASTQRPLQDFLDNFKPQ